MFSAFFPRDYRCGYASLTDIMLFSIWSVVFVNARFALVTLVRNHDAVPACQRSFGACRIQQAATKTTNVRAMATGMGNLKFIVCHS